MVLHISELVALSATNTVTNFKHDPQSVKCIRDVDVLPRHHVVEDLAEIICYNPRLVEHLIDLGAREDFRRTIETQLLHVPLKILDYNVGLR